MTTKQFESVNIDDELSYIIIDGVQCYVDTGDDVIIVNKLNELTDKIEQLKQQLLDVRKENYGNLDGLNYYQEQNGHLSSKISDLECENEQLKKSVKRQQKENEKSKVRINTFIEGNKTLQARLKELKKENQGIQNKVIRLLDFVEIKQCVTRTEIKKWWNND